MSDWRKNTDIFWAQLRAPFKPLDNIVLWYSRNFRGRIIVSRTAVRLIVAAFLWLHGNRHWKVVVVVVRWHKEAVEEKEGKSGSVLLLFDESKMKMARKPGKKQKENPVVCCCCCCCSMKTRWKMARKPGKKQKENPVGCTGEEERKIQEKGQEKVRRELSWSWCTWMKQTHCMDYYILLCTS